MESRTENNQCVLSLDCKEMKEKEGILNKNQIIQNHISQDNILAPCTKTGILNLSSMVKSWMNFQELPVKIYPLTDSQRVPTSYSL